MRLDPRQPSTSKEPSTRMGWTVRDRIEEFQELEKLEGLPPRASQGPEFKEEDSECNRMEPSGRKVPGDSRKHSPSHQSLGDG